VTPNFLAVLVVVVIMVTIGMTAFISYRQGHIDGYRRARAEEMWRRWNSHP
jgi:hypothetical protein